MAKHEIDQIRSLVDNFLLCYQNHGFQELIQTVPEADLHANTSLQSLLCYSLTELEIKFSKVLTWILVWASWTSDWSLTLATHKQTNFEI